MRSRPLVSIVTPSYNAARYIEQTILSVLSQDYANIEYLVMDGGSADGTVEILKRYEGRLRYVSAPDGGPADAINRGFRASRGAIFAWLNADDTYLAGAVSAAVAHFHSQPDHGVGRQRVRVLSSCRLDRVAGCLLTDQLDLVLAGNP